MNLIALVQELRNSNVGKAGVDLARSAYHNIKEYFNQASSFHAITFRREFNGLTNAKEHFEEDLLKLDPSSKEYKQTKNKLEETQREILNLELKKKKLALNEDDLEEICQNLGYYQSVKKIAGYFSQYEKILLISGKLTPGLFPKEQYLVDALNSGKFYEAFSLHEDHVKVDINPEYIEGIADVSMQYYKRALDLLELSFSINDVFDYPTFEINKYVVDENSSALHSDLDYDVIIKVQGYLDLQANINLLRARVLHMAYLKIMGYDNYYELACDKSREILESNVTHIKLHIKKLVFPDLENLPDLSLEQV